MKLTFLGTGNAFVPQRDWGCILVDDTTLLDAPPSALRNLKRLGRDPAAIRHICISHFHGDHFFGLPFLLLDYHFVSRTDMPLTIIGPPGIAVRTRQVMELAYADLADRGWPRPMHFVEVEAGITQEADGLTFSAIQMDHGDATVLAFGYRLYLADGVLAYSGDTRMTEALFTLCNGACAAVLEASAQDVSSVHLGREALRRVLAGIADDCMVFLNHLDTPDGDAWRELRAIVPEDLQSYTIPCASASRQD